MLKDLELMGLNTQYFQPKEKIIIEFLFEKELSKFSQNQEFDIEIRTKDFMVLNNKFNNDSIKITCDYNKILFIRNKTLYSSILIEKNAVSLTEFYDDREEITSIQRNLQLNIKKIIKKDSQILFDSSAFFLGALIGNREYFGYTCNNYTNYVGELIESDNQEYILNFLMDKVDEMQAGKYVLKKSLLKNLFKRNN